MNAGSMAPRTPGDSDAFANAASLAGVGTLRFELGTDRVWWDEQTDAILGHPPIAQGCSSRVMRDLTVAEDRGRQVADTDQLIRQGGTVETEVRIRRPSGEIRHVIVRRALQCDEHGRPVVVHSAVLDVTERRLALARWRFALEVAGQGVWDWNLITDKEYFSPSLYETMLGYTRAEWHREAEPLDARVHPDDRQLMRGHVGQLLQGDAARCVCEYRLLCADGSHIWVLDQGACLERDAQGRPTRLVGSLTDQTERRRQEQALRDARDRLELATHTAGLGVWEWDADQQSFVFDEQMRRIYGLDQARLTMAEWLDCIHPDDRSRLAQQPSLRPADDGTGRTELRIVRRDGQVRHIVTSFIPQLSGDEPRTRLVGINLDITEQRMAQAQRLAREAAEQANSAKTAFLSRISHELRTPLNAVLGFAQLLQADDRLDEEQQERVGHINRAGWHLLDLINEILDLSRIEAGVLSVLPVAVNLHALSQECLDLMAPQARQSGVELAPLPPGDVWAEADPVRLKQVLLNLLSNAIKYNVRGGQVAVSIGRLASRTRRRGSRAWSEAPVCLTVRDTGMGMSTDQQAHLFEPFNRLGRDRDGVDGTGIGLAISRSLMHLMGGEILVRSSPGRGSVFELRLRPAASPTPALHVAAAGLAPDPAGIAQHRPMSGPTLDLFEPPLTGRVLYVEDDPVNTLLVEHYLASHPGLVLLKAGNGHRGLQLARRRRPDLVLLDMRLPDMDGFEWLRRLQADERTRDLHCVALSASAMPDEVARAMTLGVLEYWTKPIQRETFLAGILRVLSAPRAGLRPTRSTSRLASRSDSPGTP